VTLVVPGATAVSRPLLSMVAVAVALEFQAMPVGQGAEPATDHVQAAVNWRVAPTSRDVALPAAVMVMLWTASVVQALLCHDWPVGQVTVMTTVPETLLEALVPVMVVVPGETAVTTPVELLTVATVGAEEV